MVKEDKSFARYMYLFCSEISTKQEKRSVFTVQPKEALKGATISLPKTKLNKNRGTNPYDNSMPFRLNFNSQAGPINMNLISYKAFGEPEVFAYLDLKLLIL